MARSIKLTESAAREVNVYRLGAYRLRVVASDAAGIDPHVFLYHRAPVDPYTGVAADYFATVARHLDMVEVPAGAPDASRRYPWFRQSFVELDVRSSAAAAEVIALLTARVQVLLEAADRLEDLVVTREVLLVSRPDPADPDGSSESASDPA